MRGTALLHRGGCLGFCVTPEGDECAVVATITTDRDYEETVLLLRRNLQRRLASRDLEVVKFDVAVDESAWTGPPRCRCRSLILPDHSRSVLEQDRSGARCADTNSDARAQEAS